MKLGIIRLAYTPFGGAEKSIERIARALQQNSDEPHSVTLFSANWTAPSQYFNVQSIAVKGFGRAARFRDFSTKVRQAVGDHQLDIVQTHERIAGFDIFRAGDGCHAAWLERLRQIRGISGHFLNWDPYHRIICDAEAAIAADPKITIVCNSALVKEEFQRFYGVDSVRLVIIPNGIDTTVFRPVALDEKNEAKKTLGLPTDRPMVLFVGSGFERKGAFELVHALVLQKDLQAVIVGKDKEEAKLRQLVNSLGLASRVMLAGPQPDPGMFYKAADLFCLPSLYDSFPNAALEAMSCGIPVLLTPGVGVAQAVQLAGAGVMTERSPEAIAEGLDRLVSAAQTYGDAARQFAMGCDHVIVGEQWMRLYRQQRDRMR